MSAVRTRFPRDEPRPGSSIHDIATCGRQQSSFGSRRTSRQRDNQERKLRATAERAGHGVVGGLPRCGHFGYHGRDKRQGFDACTKTPLGAEFDVFMAWSVDRLGRSLQDLTAFMQELRSPKIDLFLRQQGLDTHDACRQNDVSGAWLISSMRGT